MPRGGANNRGGRGRGGANPGAPMTNGYSTVPTSAPSRADSDPTNSDPKKKGMQSGLASFLAYHFHIALI